MGDKSEPVIDQQLLRFVAAEEQRKVFNMYVHKLTSQCWDLCVGTPSQRLDKKTESCISNCVERLIDTSNFVVHRLEKEGEAMMRHPVSDVTEDLGDSGQGFKWQ
jgi:import inner membrane translocase subunit TIM8